MYFGRTIIVTDVLVDPVWEDYRELAVAYGFRACWSTPIFSAQKRVLGSFAMYYPDPRPPLDEETRLVEVAANIAGIAIEHHRALEALRRSEERNRAILRAIPDWMFILDPNGVFVDYHAKNPSRSPGPTRGVPRQSDLGRAAAGHLECSCDRNGRCPGVRRAAEVRVLARVRSGAALLRSVRRPL